MEAFVRSSVAAAAARPPRPSMPSLVTIEMGLRKPTTWAVLLLTLGVSFGVVLARVASRPRAPSPVAMSAAPREGRVASTPASGVTRVASATPSQETPTLATTVISAAPASGAPLAHASSAPTRALHSSRGHHAAPPETPASAPDDKTAATAPPADADGTQDVSSASSERVQQELSDSL
jgi:hypothetical protein